ncbi:MAG: aspartate carbamoyltransferase catalytic subunit [Deltaproteobacteria bacterium]|nr:aspartate carbamoyltransferase catalytic subunit [Deltaproteobacteria bacterium]
MQLARKDLLGIEELSKKEIELILETAKTFQEISTREVKKVPTLRGKTVINLFFEDSTRTRTSFEIAGKRLSADVINISQKGSSVAKGETLLDTAKNIEAMGPDLIVCRHKSAGVPQFLASRLKASIINAGDGAHEHPTQALLDLMTIREAKGKIAGLNVAIVGDIAHSRVTRSNIHALNKMGAHVTVVGPLTMLPVEIGKMGVRVSTDLKEGTAKADVIMMLRIQRERLLCSPFPTLREYSRLYGLNKEALRTARPDVVIMHPGPVNRGVEIDPEVADGPYSLILDQVTNGVAVRMAVLYLLSGQKGEGARSQKPEVI